MNTYQTTERCFVCNKPLGDEETHDYHDESCGSPFGNTCACGGGDNQVHDRCCAYCLTVTQETNRLLRGHRFFPPCELVATIPGLYATDGVGDERIIYMHYFVGACDWWLAELDPVKNVAFGYACLGDPQCAEWGYVNLVELEAILVQRGGLPILVERGLYWRPTAVRDVALPGPGQGLGKVADQVVRSARGRRLSAA